MAKVLVDKEPDPVRLTDDSGAYIAPCAWKSGVDGDGKTWWLVQCPLTTVESLAQACQRAGGHSATVRPLPDDFDLPTNASTFTLADPKGAEVEMSDGQRQAAEHVARRRRGPGAE